MRRLDERRLFTITVEPAFAAAWLVRRLQGFRHQQPDIDVLIDASLRIVDLEREAADVAIRYGGTAGAGLIVHRLFDDEVIAVCSPAVAAGPPPIEGLGDLAKAAWIHFEMSPWPRGWLDWAGWLRALGAEGIESRRDLRFTDYTVALQAAAAGAAARRPEVAAFIDWILAEVAESPHGPATAPART
jgi:LysR family glycine cleavage system transcriptional activator